MAAYDDDAYPDDDEFDDYNPHPYSGGYDISATYGTPRPPSTATCYPVSTPAAVPARTAPQPSWSSPPQSSPPPKPSPAPSAPPKPSPAPAAPPKPSPAPAPPAPSPPAQTQQPRPSSPPPAPAPPAEPYYWPEPYSWADAPASYSLYPTPEVFRGWPYYAGPHCHTTCCGRDYWRQCMRGLDYLFGHSDGYGERVIGVDCAGLPIYANRKGGVQDAVVVEVPQPATETVQWHYARGEETDQSNRLSWHGSAQDGANANAEPAYASYDPSYQQPYSSQNVYDEPSWFSNHSYQKVEDYKQQDSQFQYQDYSSYDAYNISSQPTVCYNQHFSEEPLHIHVEPPETVSSHKLEYYENFSTYGSGNDVDYMEGSRSSYEIQPYLHTPSDELEPYRPSWSQNLGYYQACTEGLSSDYDNHTMAYGESWDMSSLFMSPFYPQETQIYNHSYGDENV